MRSKGTQGGDTLSLDRSGGATKDKVMPNSLASAVSELPFPTVPDVIFANERESLRSGRLSPGVRAVYSLAVGGYLE